MGLVTCLMGTMLDKNKTSSPKVYKSKNHNTSKSSWENNLRISVSAMIVVAVFRSAVK